MGLFSWLYADTNRQMFVNLHKESYLLIPKPFQKDIGSSYIVEHCYHGEGRMGGHDIYELVADWNRDYIPTYLQEAKTNPHAHSYALSLKDYADMMLFYEGKTPACEIRWIGILLAGEDEDNARLPYPIKITESLHEYEEMPPSRIDPMQGCM